MHVKNIKLSTKNALYNNNNILDIYIVVFSFFSKLRPFLKKFLWNISAKLDPYFLNINTNVKSKLKQTRDNDIISALDVET